jgi:uncharacterized protein (TIGR03085 family)
MPRYARIERHALADALLAAGPDAPTLCDGWTARDLAAHVVVRDRRPDAAPGIMFKPLAGWTERVRDRVRDAHPYPDLVAMVRNGPRLSPMNLPVLDEMTNTVEFFVHAEDARRGRPGWEPRSLDAGLAEGLWRRLPPLARLNLRRIPDTVRIEAPGRGAFTVGDGEPSVTATGDPGELLLFFMGRQSASRVDISGDTAAVTRLAGATFGI